MRHVKPVSRIPMPAQGQLSLIEQVTLLIFSVFFRDWDNFFPVIQNLQKYYSKTP